MSQKISPTAMRVGVTSDWKSRWFASRSYLKFLKEDIRIRQFLEKKLKGMAVDSIQIERFPAKIGVIIFTARPGLLIGRGGTGADDLRKEISKIIKEKVDIKIEIQEFRHPESSAKIVAEQIAEQLEKRISFRRVMKQAMSKVRANRDIKGIKIELAGRLDGAEIAREERLEEGGLPLQYLKANIDFAKDTAFTTYGTVGIKVWIYK